MLTTLRRRRGGLLYLLSSLCLLLFGFLTTSSKNFKLSSLSGASLPWQTIDYDEYGCGCPRSGLPIRASEDESLCSDWSTSRGSGQRVVSYTVYGDMNKRSIHRQYFATIEDRLQDVQKYYEGWILRLYHNASLSDATTRGLICELYCRYPHFDPCQADRIYFTHDTHYITHPTTSTTSSYSAGITHDNHSNHSSNSHNHHSNNSSFDYNNNKNNNNHHLTSQSNYNESSINHTLLVNSVWNRDHRGTAYENDIREESSDDREDGGNGLMAIFKKASQFQRIGLPESNARGEVGRNYGRSLVGKMWRFLPMGDPLVSEFLVRDVDSAILAREVAAVHQWLHNSTAILHIMRDHPSHNGRILAGMWGGSRVRGGDKLAAMLAGMARWPPRQIWDYDQVLLQREVWPEVLDSVLAHDSYFCANPHFQSRHRAAPFPTRRQGHYFVGWGPLRDHELPGIIACPYQCRPHNHQDWALC